MNTSLLHRTPDSTSEPTLHLRAPAKINLFLHITGQRADGYHQLQTLFQLIDLCDELSFKQSADNSLTLSGDLNEKIPPQDNIIIKAAQLLRQTSGCSKGAEIKLSKNIPMGGGLGGGSSNAATTLLALNHLWNTGLNLDELAELGLLLGADVPVFIYGQNATAEGIGEQITPIELPEHWYIVIKPACEVPTIEIFSHPQLTRDTQAIRIAAFFEAETFQNGASIPNTVLQAPDGRFHNDCETLARQLYPKIDIALNWLDEQLEATQANNKGLNKARLTGTGSCIFAKCSTQAIAKAIAEAVPDDMTAFVARGLSSSPTHDCLK